MTVRKRYPRAARWVARGRWIGMCSAALLASCAPTTNLVEVNSPRFAANYAQHVADSSASGTAASLHPLRIVTFNIKFAQQIDRAIDVLQSDSLRNADIVTLQEMDEKGVERIAHALGLNYVYYPGSIHPVGNKYYGPAVLSRWPIEESSKLVLPHIGRFRRQQRTATVAVVRVRQQRVKVYGVHFETQLRVSESARRDQVSYVLSDAAKFQGPVVIAGDFNSHGIGPFLVRNGYRWLTADVGPTVEFFTWDHIFVRNFAPSPAARVGVVREVHGASDHHPVWAVVAPEAPVVAGTGVSKKS